MKLNLKDYSKGEAIRIIREWTNLTKKDLSLFKQSADEDIEII